MLECVSDRDLIRPDLSKPGPDAEPHQQSADEPQDLVPKNSRMKRRFPYAMGVYAILGLFAGFTLAGDIRIATLVFLAGLGLKTYLAVLRDRAD